MHTTSKWLRSLLFNGLRCASCTNAPVAVTRRLERRHIDQVGQVGAAEARGALGNGLQSLVVQPDTCGRGMACTHLAYMQQARASGTCCCQRLLHALLINAAALPAHRPASPWPHLEVHVCGPRDLAKVHLQDLAPALHIGVGHLQQGGRGRAAGMSRGWRSARGVVQESRRCWQVSNSLC